MSFRLDQYSQPLLEAVLGSLREGILVIDRQTEVVLYNQAAIDIFNLSPVMTGPLRLIDITRNKAIHDGFHQVLEEGRPFDANLEIFGVQERTFSFRATPLIMPSAHEVVGAIGVFFDVTQLVRLERVRREFFANLSHELRTPLTSILAYVETLLNGALYDNENNLQFLRIINKHATRMQNLVRDIADLSAIEAGEFKLEPVTIDLKTFVDNLSVLVLPEATARQVTFRNDVPPGIQVQADPQALEQILMNLIINAVKFNRPGGEVVVTASFESDVRTLIAVRDTGIGIEAKHLGRIFERLYRVDKSRSQEVGGTGLGLAIVKHLVLNHGGDVSVDSTPGVGSEFRVRLPRPMMPTSAVFPAATG
ncbi:MULTISPECIES: cell wall metabolism sensor histidine kinase WalK [Chloracidobacterium]|jgi:two-component system phosphate regulon sensor histidine kinase PhoR|uniref:histidine kinase n=1 Tax=Chloracidobacterium sp. N TaxID=2821540 RepID=A0ABX8B006_9BACT|nr:MULTISPECIES: ATP-binding protein [Chloracidobacterium]QUV83686.1 PAS domain-containing protein [Chloracidobacterium sp. 2]QUV87834.1 PAS domain-containing protein [Chloracidobacterium sp. S]QUV90732.1 PAS domain-containing protein [Chloracidobacterium sp. A]QUV93947.1 PAS domain-containing protein [Chloracidobacterium sp. N]QUV97139.1 PAS domain-containing protein [Chloracidobacterium sp. E]